MDKFKKLLKVSWFYTLYFNFHYLPFKQAIKLPIFLFKPKLLKCKGTLEIKSETIRTGMIELGYCYVPLFHNTGIIWKNDGGKVIFRGKSNIGNSSLSISKTGLVDFGHNFIASSNMKLHSCHYISFGDYCRVAWNVIILDTSLHHLKDINGQYKDKGFAPVMIGKNNWITINCTVLKGAKTPDYCVFGSGSIINKDYSDYPTHILMAGNPLKVKANQIWRDVSDDEIIYEHYSLMI